MDVQAKPSTGNTALHSFAKHGLEENIVQEYEDRNDIFMEEVNYQNHEGETPLHYAYRYGHLNIAKRLMNYGADEKIKDNKGRTPKEVEELGEGE